MSESNTEEEIINTDDELLVSLGCPRVLRTEVSVLLSCKNIFIERRSTQYRMENSKKSIDKSFRKT